MKKRFFILILFSFSLINCKSYVQVLETKTTNTKLVDDKFIFENDTIKVTYDFWNENGLLSFKILNKTSKPIYIDWKKSSYINNSVKLNYWNDEENTKTKGVSNSLEWFDFYSTTYIQSNSVTTKSERITFIPPNSNIIKSTFKLLPPNYLKDLHYTNSKIPDVINKNIDVDVLTIDFNVNSSPLTFRNFFTYSFSENFEKEYYVNNEFFISKVTKIRDDHFESYWYNIDKNNNLFFKDERGISTKTSPFKKGIHFI